MPGQNLRGSAVSGLTIACAFILTGAAANADQPAGTFSQEQVFTALIEPNLDADGRLPLDRRQKILITARKMLDKKQLRRFEGKLASYVRQTAEPPLLEQPAPPARPTPSLIQAQLPGEPPTLPPFIPAPIPSGTRQTAPPTVPAPIPAAPLQPAPTPWKPNQPAAKPAFPGPVSATPIPQPVESPLPMAPLPLSSGQKAGPASEPAGPPALVCGPDWLFGPQGYAYPSWRAGPTSCTAGLLDNADVFIGLDGAKGPEDLGINANFGGRAHVNFAVPVSDELGLGVQIGTGINYHNNTLATLETIDGKQDRMQSFSTVGIFQRTDFGLNWAIVWDYLAEWYWADFALSQFRGQIGYELTSNDEIGVWGTIGDSSATVNLNGASYILRPINQGNLFWKHIWPNNAITRVWVGLAENHHQFVLTNPGRPQANNPFVYGADVFVPLNNWVSLFGQANFMTPADSGTVTAVFGLSFNLGGGARDWSRSRFAPMMSVANNPTFAVDLLAPR